MTGTWEGEFGTPGGTRFAIFLDLGRRILESGEPETENYQGAIVDGQAAWCDSHGRHAEDVIIHGAVPAFSGYNGVARQVEIDLESASHPQQGLLPDTFTGSWNTDTLTLQPTFMYWDGKTFAYSSLNPDLNTKITVTLKKADERAYRAACAALGNAVP